MGKRKYFDDQSRSDARGMSIGEAYGELKRARTSPSESPVAGMDRSDEQIKGDDGWQVVSSKRNRTKGKRDSAINNRHEDKTPKIYFDPRQDSRQTVRLEDLRDLALYILTDSTAPSWIAVKRCKEIRKVVVVMVPGMDESMIASLERLTPNSGTNGQVDIQSNFAQNENSTTANSPKRVSENTTKDDSTRETNVYQEIRLEDSNIRWLLDGRFRVRAPGDSRQPKVHSPLQAMIMKGTDEVSNLKKGTSPLERPFHSVRTPIIDFIHSADELREAEYPTHPALFTSGTDRSLELKRRAGAKQDSSHGWVDSEVKSHQPEIPSDHRDFVSQGLKVYAIDCEMVLTSDEKSSLARISVVSWPDGRVVLDKYVKPDLTIVNYFTQYSGITEKILENVTTRLSDIQEELMSLFTPSTILLGHSLESDLNALKMTHPFIIDTSMIYPHPRGLPLRSSLKFLAKKYLKREIQKGGLNGHDSVEDARAVLDLVRLKCEKGPKWGTNEANGETVFKKISRSTRHDGRGRTHAIVEYGTPERGFGRDATVAIGCQDDEDIVRGVLRCCNGDRDENERGEIPDGGVDFVWARLRALEYARGWMTQNPMGNVTSQPPISAAVAKTKTTNEKESPAQETQALSTKTHGIDSSSNPPPPSPQPNTAELDTVLQTTITNINKIHDSLPKNTLLILCSGTSDMHLVTHYQSLQTQYRKEFKVKKWDELSVRWTDVEEQALRKAVEDARMGWGWVGVV